jgi:two-component system, oxyanion-binding sensor
MPILPKGMGATVLHKTKQTCQPLRVGFVPLSDCAPIVMAQELNLFAKYGLKVQLSREIGWASLRDKICYGQLDAAHALAPMAVALTLGLGVPATPSLTGLVLNLEGNGITLAKRFWPGDAPDEAALGQRIQDSPAPLLFGIPFLFSAHHFLLRRWLHGLGLVPDRVARFVVVPPPQMPSHLRAGNLDGYCVGEPWNRLATLSNIGWLAATSAQLDPGHPEKVLLLRRDFAEGRSEEHVALIAALLDACSFCQAPENALEIAQVLARPNYVNTSVVSLQDALGPIFHGPAVNDPSAAKAAWVVDNFRKSGLNLEQSVALASAGPATFRTDIFQQGLRRQHSQNETQSNHHPIAALV